MKRKILVICTIMAVSLLGCGQTAQTDMEIVLEQEEDNSQFYATVEVTYGDVLSTQKINCSYSPTVQKDYFFGIDGKMVAQASVKKGDLVEKGQLLAALDEENLEKEIARLEHDIAALELNLQHLKESKALDLENADILYSYTAKSNQDKKNLTKNKKLIEERYNDSIEDLEDQLTICKMEYERSKTEWEDGRIYSDLDGVVSYCKDYLTQSVSAKDEKVFSVSDLDSCLFVVEDMTYADYFKSGCTYNVDYSLSGLSGGCAVEPYKIDTWEDKMYFALCEEEILDAGLSGTITIELETKENVLCVPVSALHQSEDADFVYVLRDGIKTMQYVSLGLIGSQKAEIISGLSEGELVITDVR